METKRYVIEGDPVGWSRSGVRYDSRRIYDRQRTLKDMWKLLIKQQHNSHVFIHPPIGLRIVFYMPIPYSWSRKHKEAALGQYHTNPCDLDNLTKLILDCSQQIILMNDCQVSKMQAIKVYDANPRTEWILEHLPSRPTELFV